MSNVANLCLPSVMVKSAEKKSLIWYLENWENYFENIARWLLIARKISSNKYPLMNFNEIQHESSVLK